MTYIARALPKGSRFKSYWTWLDRRAGRFSYTLSPSSEQITKHWNTYTSDATFACEEDARRAAFEKSQEAAP